MTLLKRFVKESYVPLTIKEIKYGLLSATDVKRLAHLKIFKRELYALPSRTPMPNGCLDGRMGVSTKGQQCETCGQDLADCSGHYGFIELHLPVFHIGYFRNTLQTLQMICKTCARLLINDEDQSIILSRLKHPRIENLQRRMIFNLTIAKCKKVSICPHCGATNGVVKKVGSLKIIHDKYKKRPKFSGQEQFLEQFEDAIESNPEIGQHVNKTMENITPRHALDLFSKIPVHEYELLDMDPEIGDPTRMIITHLLVPPVCIRPSIGMEDVTSGSNEDDLSMKLAEIVHINNILGTALEKCSSNQVVMEDWDFLQLQCAMYINSELPGIPSSFIPGKPIRGLCQRLKGKTGRFRGNLSGKRVDFSSRTVISPDPNLEIDEVAVPVSISRTLTFPEVVTEYNIEWLRNAVINGISPKYGELGANFVEFSGVGKRYLRYGDRRQMSEDIQPGDVVERHMTNGDVVLFNRQPSLHKMSIMAHKVRIMPGKTFRINLCVCAPYNADFDGDEMNLHFPQTHEARSDAIELMGVKDNIISPRTGAPLIAPTQDFLTASFILTKRDVFFSRSTFCQFCAYAGGHSSEISIPEPCILKPVELWSGKQVYTYALWRTGARVSLENPGRIFKGSTRSDKDRYLDPEDGYVVIQEGEHLSGILCKKTLGAGTKNGLIAVLIRDFSNEEAQKFMGYVSRLTTGYLSERGLSFGMDDVEVTSAMAEMSERLKEKHYANCENYIEQFNNGKLVPIPGCDEEQTLEARIASELSQIRDTVGNECLNRLSKTNSALLMMLSGSKGSAINISQMIACIGQQTVSGKRIEDGFINRTLPHFRNHSKKPQAKGFVGNSFFTGINPTEFFFHACAGREGLVDTAVKTAETGYMQRRLMKALEDVTAQYDGTVRIPSGQVVQFIYGDDGIDPGYIDHDNSPYNLGRILSSLQQERSGKEEYSLAPIELLALTDIMCKDLVGILPNALIEKIKIFFNQYSDRISELRKSIGLSPYGVKKDNGIQGGNLDFLSPFLVLAEDSSLTGYVNKIISCTYLDLKALFIEVKNRFLESKVVPGDAVGAIAAQSIGEPATQMSIPGHIEVVYRINGVFMVSGIGEFVDSYLGGAAHFVEGSIVIDIAPTEEIEVPSLKRDGEVRWSRLLQVSRHEPNGSLIEVTTRSGRVIEATKDHSFVKRIGDEVLPVAGSSLIVGDEIPLVQCLNISKRSGSPQLVEKFANLKEIELTTALSFLFGIGFAMHTSRSPWKDPLPMCIHLNDITAEFKEDILSQCCSSGNLEFIEEKRESIHVSMSNLCSFFKKKYTAILETLLGENIDHIRAFILGYICNTPSSSLKQNLSPDNLEVECGNTHMMHLMCLLFSRLGIGTKQQTYSHSFTVESRFFPTLVTEKGDSVLWDEIVKIREVECSTDFVYDFTVETDETFMTSSGLITHNTLKTFHFAGVSSMNVTLGVPRIKEIINAVTSISTPIITAELLCDNDINAARIVKGRIEKTTLGEICKRISEVFTKRNCYISVLLDLELISSLQLSITVGSVIEAILSNSKLKVKKECITVKSDKEIRILPSESNRKKMAFNLQFLRANLHRTLVNGYNSISRAVINQKREGTYNLLVEGDDYENVLGTNGVDFARTVCNSLKKVQEILGIEAVRKLIIDEIIFTMESYGIFVDKRHILLLSDLMTFMGEVLGITRFGIAKMKDSVMMLASFERTTDHLFDAAVHSRVNEVSGTSENIIMGKPIPLGSGMAKLINLSGKDPKPERKVAPILERPEVAPFINTDKIRSRVDVNS